MTVGEFVTADHLGGYRLGGDEATFYPQLWEWLVSERNVRSVVDVGCGEGHALDVFQTLGCEVLGIDGVEQEHPFIETWDYTVGKFNRPILRRSNRRWDLCWSCEFVEHVEERYVPNFLATFSCADLVLMTHAFPGQDGYHHVNCRSADYWLGSLASIGYRLDPELTSLTRELAATNQSPFNHYVRSGLAFRRTP